MRSLVLRAAPQVQAMVSVAPGLALAVGLALLAKLAASSVTTASVGVRGLPVSPVLLAVLLGVLWRNTLGVPERAAVGVDWTMQTVLRIGIALIGFRLTVAGAGSSAATAALVAVACIITALALAALLQRWLQISDRQSLLLAIGAAVCGCTAVAALAPVIRAKGDETSIALVGVVLFGCAAMLIYPQLAHHFFASSPHLAGVFLGTSIHDTSQVIGAALIYAQQFNAPAAVDAASVAKVLRNLSIAVLIPAMALLYGRSGPLRMASSRACIPAFVVAFAALMLLRSTGDVLFADGDAARGWRVLVATSQHISELLLICGMSAVGFGVSLRDVRTVGWRPLLGALLIAIAVGVCSLALTSALRLVH